MEAAQSQQEQQVPPRRAVASVRLSMLNLDDKIDDNNRPMPLQKRPANDCPHSLSNQRKQAVDWIREQRQEIALSVYAHDDNNRINERDPSVCLNYIFLKQWCMMNTLEMYDIDHVFS